MNIEVHEVKESGAGDPAKPFLPQLDQLSALFSSHKADSWIGASRRRILISKHYEILVKPHLKKYDYFLMLLQKN